MDADHIITKDPTNLPYGFGMYSRDNGANNVFKFLKGEPYIEDLMTVKLISQNVMTQKMLSTAKKVIHRSSVSRSIP